MMKYKQGNMLTEAKLGILCHQVNPDGVMGAGIAAQIAKKWPNVEEEYVKRCFDPAPLKLGTVQMVVAEPGIIVANLFTQRSLKTPLPRTDYNAYPKALTLLRSRGVPLHFPKGIGCGLGGSRWEVVEPLIQWYLGYSEDVTIWEYQP